jgi:ribonuclease HI
MNRIVLHTDGASRGNPGDAGIGVVITDPEGNILSEIADYIGVATNNVAEYTALVRGLHEAVRLGATEVVIATDSELMARQISGVYKVKSANLKPVFEEAITLLRAFANVSISHVMREFNKRADELANEGIDRHKKQDISSHLHRPTGKQKTLDL